MVNKIEELEKIKTLKDMGSITEQEFEIEKQKILNSDENNSTKTEGIYTASLVLGICSFLFAGIPILGLILSIIGLIISIKSRKKLKANNETKGIVTAGFILSIIGLILSILIFVFVFLGIGIAFMEGENGVLTSANISMLETKEVEMPNVVGLSVEQAKEEIEKANLRFEVEKEEYNKDVEEGYVISQNPTYYIEGFNKVKENSTISVVVSKGQEKAIVPNVEGKEKEEAIRLIEEANLKVQIIEETSKNVKEGYVVSQETNPDIEVSAGDTVIIHISTALEQSKEEEQGTESSNNSSLTSNNYKQRSSNNNYYTSDISNSNTEEKKEKTMNFILHKSCLIRSYTWSKTGLHNVTSIEKPLNVVIKADDKTIFEDTFTSNDLSDPFREDCKTSQIKYTTKTVPKAITVFVNGEKFQEFTYQIEYFFEQNTDEPYTLLFEEH